MTSVNVGTIALAGAGGMMLVVGGLHLVAPQMMMEAPIAFCRCAREAAGRTGTRCVEAHRFRAARCAPAVTMGTRGVSGASPEAVTCRPERGRRDAVTQHRRPRRRALAVPSPVTGAVRNTGRTGDADRRAHTGHPPLPSVLQPRGPLTSLP